MAVVTGEIVEPSPYRPNEGFFHFNVEFSPMASPAFEVGRPSAQGVEIGRVVERVIKQSRALDVESLCILSGQKVKSFIHVILFTHERFGLLEPMCMFWMIMVILRTVLALL